jgi:hypothetical protein
MFERLFDIPLVIAGPAIIAGLCVFGVAGLLLVRRWILPRLRIQAEDSEFVGAMIQCVMVFYGLAVALIAVNVWQTYSNVQSVVAGEASALDALYRDVSSYPEPIRLELQENLRTYTDQIIHGAFPLMRRGQTPTAGFAYMTRFQAILDKFEPVTEGQKILHAETLRAYNLLIEARRLRLDAASACLPTVMWIVIIVGGCISLTTSFFVKIEDARLHAIMVMLLAGFMGLVIFMTFAFDRPFRGDLGIDPQPYQLIYDRLMNSNP